MQLLIYAEITNSNNQFNSVVLSHFSQAFEKHPWCQRSIMLLKTGIPEFWSLYFSCRATALRSLWPRDSAMMQL